MTKRTGKCINFGECGKADKKESIDVALDQEFVCPECSKPLQIANPTGGKFPAKAMAVAAPLLLAAAGSGYWLMRPAMAAKPLIQAKVIQKTAPACALRPAKPNDVGRLLAYLKQGMNYALHESYNDALREFSEIAKIDANFLSVGLNRGSALLRVGRLDEAEAAMRAELDLISCLEKFQDDSELGAFGYMLEVQRSGAPQALAERGRLMRERLAQVKAQAHFNLGCIHARRESPDAAVAELKLALTLDRRLESQTREDSDLLSIRTSASFRALLMAMTNTKDRKAQ